MINLISIYLLMKKELIMSLIKLMTMAIQEIVFMV